MAERQKASWLFDIDHPLCDKNGPSQLVIELSRGLDTGRNGEQNGSLLVPVGKQTRL